MSLYENTLVEYDLADNALIVEEESKKQQDKKQVLDMVDRLRGIDPDLDEMLEALLILKTGAKKFQLNANLLMEYGLIDNPTVMAIEHKRLEMQAMINSNKDINNLLEAVMILKGEQDGRE